VAGLDHPNVVLVLDHGGVGKAAEVMTRGRMAQGSPYLAMELAVGGTLDPMCGRLAWRDARRVLSALLNALGHAHARGVLHLDLKPANVLVATNERGKDEVRLTDFGLAGALGSLSANRRVVMGTPPYMAPEQFTGRTADFGPWTDLYALGCLAWHLLTGAPPFPGQGLDEAREQHTAQPAPRLHARVMVPVGLEAWLHRLLEKRPGWRYRCAADAAYALQELGPPIVDPDTIDEAPATLATAATLIVAQSSESLEAEDREVWREMTHADAPPISARWKRKSRPRRAALAGTSLGLIELRDVPLVGRTREQSLLWTTLADVSKTSRPRLVCLLGTAGVGKTALAMWLKDRVQELGAATALMAQHTSPPRPDDGLQGLVTTLVHASPLRSEVENRVRLTFPELVGGPSRALVDMAMGQDGSEERQVAVVSHVIAALAVHRPVLVVLDDALRDDAALMLADRVLEIPGRVMIVATVRDDDAPAHPRAAAVLDSLMDRDGTLALDIPPLDTKSAGALLDSLLPLQRGLRHRIVRQTRGNPQFALAAVRDLVQGASLAPTPKGFALRPGVRLQIPDTLRDVWVQRLLGALDGDAQRDAVALAAALGDPVVTAEWHDAAGRLDLTFPHRALDRLRAARFSVHTEDGWEFAHPMLAEAALHLAADAGRLSAIHAACAEMLAATPGADPERLGRHLSASGQYEAALAPLALAARRALVSGAHRATEELLERRDIAARAIPLPASDSRWGEGWLLHAMLAFESGEHAETERWAERAAAAAEQYHWPGVRADSLRQLADIDRIAGRPVVAARTYREALALFEAHGSKAGAVRCHYGLGVLARVRGNLDEAEDHLAAATLGLAGLSASPGLHGIVHLARGGVLRQRGDLDGAEAAFKAASAVASTMPLLRCDILVGLGEVARARGDLDEAERMYTEALEAVPPESVTRLMLVEINLALIDLLRARYDAAHARLERVRVGRSAVGRAAVTFLAAPTAIVDEDPVWRRQIAACRRLVEGAIALDPDYVWVLELAADRAEQLGYLHRALTAREVAGTLARTLATARAVARGAS
jgi:tetratricopeptide (TPR) repeat protein